MRIIRQTFLAVGLVLCASTSFAVHNLKQPAGLAVDSAGNLYVANYGLNEILIYNSSYTQLISRTITQNISGPEDVAFDPYGNLWVANFIGNSNGSGGYITEYTAGVQITGATINNGIAGPLYLSFDGLDDLWVLNNGINITIYDPPGALLPPSNLARTLSTNAKVFKVSAGSVVSGTRNKTNVDSSSLVFQGAAAIGSEDSVSPADGVTAIATDNSGNTYVCDPSGNVNVLDGNGNLSSFVSLGFAARGMAVDNRNKRLYASNESGQEIVVYSTTNAAQLHIIGNPQ
jgi:sugar lactone lactonase YvrE